jgi:single-strand DNA-binding protein
MSVAVSESWKDKQTGEQKERTEWVKVEVWGNTAEACAQHLRKGSQVYVEGKMQTDKWQDRDGNDRWTTKVRADTVQFLGKPSGTRPAASDATDQDGMPPHSRTQQDEFEDDIPF